MKNIIHTYKYKEGKDFSMVAKNVMHIPEPHPTSRHILGLFE